MQPIICYLRAVPRGSVATGPGIRREIDFAHFEMEMSGKAIVGASADSTDGLAPGYSLALGDPALIEVGVLGPDEIFIGDRMFD